MRLSLVVVANEGQRIDIPDGCILENRLLSGNLNMIVRPFVSRTGPPDLNVWLR
jgi:UTP--glucose-1-phosphate uridylyltransferase